ncbi:transposase [Mariniplasma sp. M4Ah]|uniref:Transposase n=1 Tax=Peloplasma aerotolerans TaxID=3044389 RepID=A0AAW6U7J2_9MOLU|nr:transposase [Mariniplasma sp. M4Ah]MDI6453795.1 transposase [Mariniplasma sp. M4Ah]
MKATGELSDDSIHLINYDKIAEEEKFDGFFCILTSKLGYDYKKILEVYGNLWRIEESFKITKSDLQTRPIYVRTQKHIEGHMLICYTALLILRLLQYKLKDKEISVNRIKQVLNACTCVLPNDQAVMLDEIGGLLSFKEKPSTKGEMVETLTYDETKDQIRSDYQKIQKSFGVKFDYAASTREDFNKYLKQIKYRVSKK